MEIVDKVRQIAAEIADSCGVELVHADLKGGDRGSVVAIFIDKNGGVTHEDCSAVSRAVGERLEAEDFISSAYILEVSSPGLERELYSLKDYEKYAGNLAKMKIRQPIGNQRNFRGRIKGVEGDTIIFDDKTSGEVKIPFELIAKANLEIDVEEEFRLARERGENV